VEDFIGEIHDVHHPIASNLYYHDQKREARRRAQYFTADRAAQFLGYFEEVLARNSAASGYMIGRSLTYVDLSMFQLVAGLRYALPAMMTRLEPEIRGLSALHDRVAQRPGIVAYMESGRRIPFNEDGIFRHYPELDS
jgi:glutathione S-transferase